MKELTRYEANYSYCASEYYPLGPVEQADDGDYVRFDDVQAELTRLRLIENASLEVIAKRGKHPWECCPDALDALRATLTDGKEMK